MECSLPWLSTSRGSPGAATLAPFGELDRMLHWAQAFGDELASMPSAIGACDVTVLGRTERAFTTHPEALRVTEGIVNDVWSRVTGDAWDVMVGVRGMSLDVAKALVAGGPVVDGVETDVIWPLWAKREGFSVGDVATEGLEFDTADRFGPEVEAAGGPDAWQRALDADPSRWARRLEFARRRWTPSHASPDGDRLRTSGRGPALAAGTVCRPVE